MAEERRFLLDTVQHRDNAARFIGRVDIARPLELVLRPYIAQRTSKANARLWALHSKAAGVTGYSVEEMHELMLKRFFGVREIKVGNVVSEVPLKRSSMRNKKEFNEFMTSTESFYVSELGVWLE